MKILTKIKTSAYFDSVSLMNVAKELAAMPEVDDAAVIMGTDANKEFLKTADLFSPEAEKATPNDLVITIRTSEKNTDNLFEEAERLLTQRVVDEGESAEFRPKTIHSAVNANPNANIAVISVAGKYAAGEAWNALKLGLHVLLFSDNVDLEDEIALKKYARDHGLLLIGPGAGTTIINGAALGFANVVPEGPVGIVSAAGTGLQEVSTLLAKNGVGITQGIGTGGRDLSEEVGGIMMLEGLKALQEDPKTKVIALVSKPPSNSVAKKILNQVAFGDKPTVVGFMGLRGADWDDIPNAIPAATLEETALIAAALAQKKKGDPLKAIKQKEAELAERAKHIQGHLNDNQRYLRGLFAGGTLCYEAEVIWRDHLKEPVNSNVPLDKKNKLADSMKSKGHTAVDLGEEEFTVGRPHPMIDNDLRIRRLMQEAQDPEVAVIMMDVVLGYGAHNDPSSELAPAAQRALELAKKNGRDLFIISSITGTEQDPQGLKKQTEAIAEAGIIVCDSNAEASRLVGLIVNSSGGK